jgi:hypothetical protein
MHRRKTILVLLGSGIVILANAIFAANLFITSTNQRRASCEATFVALRAVSATSTSGIRPISAIPSGLDPALAASFGIQQKATIRENEKRLQVIRDVNIEIVRLKNSDFCS